jgi:HD-GYP domain-containing protein (c-di-GMP phosphodiesterase class II)/DNA-binding CsgD family transcriptional regulator
MRDRLPDGPNPPAPARAELLAALSLAIDLGLGLPVEHVLRASLVSKALAERFGGDEADQATAFYTTMFMWVGCVADSHEYSRWFGDDIAVRSASYEVDWTGMPYAVFLLRSLGHGRPLPQRIKMAGKLLSNPRGNVTAMITSHCSSAALFASRLGFGDDVCDALPFGFERWDGKGLPAGASGEQLPLVMRITQVADIAEVLHHRHGLDACVATVRERAGGWFDPDVARVFADNAGALLELPTDVWQLAVAEAPEAQEAVTEAQLDDLVMALGDFVDLKSPYTLGHSRAVAGLVGAAARHAGMTRSEQATLRRAGHLHDIGRIGVSNLVWDKPDALTATERERMQLHPFLSGRILARVPALAAETRLVVNHHERLDGSGYPNRLSGADLSLADQLLAAADRLQCLVEPRPHRAAVSQQEAADLLRQDARAGRLHSGAVDAVLAAAGRMTARGAWPAGLTDREVDVLRLVAAATPTREIAARLGITEKTVRNHIDHVFAKTGTSNRVGLSLFALTNGLAAATATPA